MRLHCRQLFLPCDCMQCNARYCCQNSVRPSDACIVTKLNDGLRIFDTTRNSDHSSFLTPTLVGGRCPLPSEICALSDPPPSKNADFDNRHISAYNVSTVRDSERSSTRKCGNYSDVLPLKAARRDSISNLTSFGASNLSCR